MMARLLFCLVLFCVSGVVWAQPVPINIPRADVAEIRYVEYHGRWYEFAIDFRSRLYTCPDPVQEHGAWTGEVESWDAATSTLVFREAYVTCQPDGLPSSGPVSLVRMRFQRCPDGAVVAGVEGGSWGKTRVSFR